MSTEIKQCWAFHQEGMRCEHPAGHPGEHVVQKTWSDEECVFPGASRQEPPALKPLPEMPPPAKPTTSCAACSHHHKEGACKCGCYEFIG